MKNAFLNQLDRHESRDLVREASQRGDYPAAIALLDRLIAENPYSAIDYNNRGLMYFYRGEYETALADFDRALALNHRLDSAYNNRANCHAAMGNTAAAIADYEFALDFNPTNLHAWINRGIAYRELALYDLALENFDIALVLGQSLQGRIYEERGRTYHLWGDWNCAISDYQKALEYSFDSDSDRQRIETWRAELLQPVGA